MANKHELARNVNKNKKVASCVTTAVALEIVGLLGTSYATDAYGPLQLMAATTILARDSLRIERGRLGEWAGVLGSAALARPAR